MLVCSNSRGIYVMTRTRGRRTPVCELARIAAVVDQHLQIQIKFLSLTLIALSNVNFPSNREESLHLLLSAFESACDSSSRWPHSCLCRHRFLLVLQGLCEFGFYNLYSYTDFGGRAFRFLLSTCTRTCRRCASTTVSSFAGRLVYLFRLYQDTLVLQPFQRFLHRQVCVGNWLQ